MLADQLTLLAQELLRLLLGVAPLAFLGLEGKLDKGGAEGLHLLLHSGPDVVSGDDRTEPAGGRDGLQAGDPGAHDQHPRRGNRAGRGLG